MADTRVNDFDLLVQDSGVGPPDTGAVHGDAVASRIPVVPLLRVIVLISFLLAWQGASGVLINRFFVSRPTEVIGRVWDLVTGDLWYHLVYTLQEMAMGYAVGALLAVVSGFVLGRIRVFGAVVEPFILTFFCIPKLAIAPLIILWFGIGIGSKVALSALLTFYVVFWNTNAGAKKVDRQLVDVVRVMGASRWQVLREAVLPSSLPWILIGLRMAVPYSLMGAIVGEILAGNRGLGYLVNYSALQFDTDGVFAVLVVMATVGFLTNQLVELLDRKTQKWAEPIE